jgi:hypothetical protein
MTTHPLTIRGETAMIAIDALDKLSRLRALDDIESWTLERLIRTQEDSVTGAARLAVWRKSRLAIAMHIPEFDHLLQSATPGTKRAIAAAKRGEG